MFYGRNVTSERVKTKHRLAVKRWQKIRKEHIQQQNLQYLANFQISKALQK